jgi:hypothetical protein
MSQVNQCRYEMSIKIIIGIGVGPTRKKNFTIFVTTIFSFLSLRTAQAKEYSLDKDQTTYDDLLDALRLSLKGYKKNRKTVQRYFVIKI